MRRLVSLIFILLVSISPTLEGARIQTEEKQFNQRLVHDIRQQIKDMDSAKIRKIMDEVESGMNKYIENMKTCRKIKNKG